MQRRTWILKIKEGKQEAYRAAHTNVWPELIAASREAGFQNHSVFVTDRTVVAYLEAENMERATERLNESRVVHQWNEAMSDLLEATGAPALEEVFHFD